MYDIDGKANSENKVGGDVIAARIHLHQAISEKMKNLGLCTAPAIVEVFKRWYLWDFHNVETSRALSLMQLKDAMKMLITVTQTTAVNALLTKYNIFESKRDVLKLTQGQANKIIAIAKYGIKINAKELKTFATKRLDRDPYINQYFAMDITMEEANKLIQALEKWEVRTHSKKAG
jgi:hypothetical protein